MSTATATKTYANLSLETVRAICKRFHAPAYHARGFLRLANHGQIRGDSFRAFIHTPRGNRVIREIMRELSEAYYKAKGIRFPPADYRVPAGYKLYV